MLNPHLGACSLISPSLPIFLLITTSLGVNVTSLPRSLCEKPESCGQISTSSPAFNPSGSFASTSPTDSANLAFPVMYSNTSEPLTLTAFGPASRAASIVCLNLAIHAKTLGNCVLDMTLSGNAPGRSASQAKSQIAVHSHTISSSPQ